MEQDEAIKALAELIKKRADRCHELEIKSSDAYFSFIKTIVSLSAVILSLTVSFQKDLFEKNSCQPWLLQVALGSLAVAVVFGLLALLGESGFYSKVAASQTEITPKRTQYPIFYILCLILSLFCFSSGVVFLALFGIVNL